MPQSKTSIAAILLVLLTGGLLLPSCSARHKTAAQVEGVVLDSAGQPLADVRVFNRGDAAEATETRTDSAGRFRLRGFDPGAVYVFAQKDGYRFTGLRTACGTTDAKVTLLRVDEPPPAWKPTTGPMSLEDQQKLAHRLLEKLWAADPQGNRTYWVIRAMSWIDPELALRWSDGSDRRYAELSRAALAEKVADDDIDEAIGLMAQSGTTGMNLLIKLGRKLATSDPIRAMQCTEELIVLARAVDQPWRAGYLAQAGALAVRLGKTNVGQALLDEATEMTARLPSDRANDAARGTVAAAMAETDFQRGQALLEQIRTNDDLDRSRANVAVAGCLTHLDQSLAIVGKMEPNDADCGTRLRIAYRLAPTRPAEAVRVAEMTGIGANGYVNNGRQSQATVLGWVARAVAQRDRSMACALIDQAFDLLLTAKEAESSQDPSLGSPATAGFLALQAQQIDYPDMQSIVYRVLACRTKKSRMSPDNMMTMAAFLALVDPQMAREILTAVESRNPGIGGPARVEAWLLADAVRGEPLFHEALAAIGEAPDADTAFYGLVEAVNLLAASPLHKAPEIAANTLFLPPDEE